MFISLPQKGAAGGEGASSKREEYVNTENLITISALAPPKRDVPPYIPASTFVPHPKRYAPRTEKTERSSGSRDYFVGSIPYNPMMHRGGTTLKSFASL